MARFGRFSAYRARGRAWMGRRSRRTRKGISIGLPFMAGMAAGYFAPRVHPLQDTAITAAAVIPMRLPMNGGNIAKGYVAGMLLKALLPNIGGMLGGQNGGTDVI